jgi:manganese transport protein
MNSGAAGTALILPDRPHRPLALIADHQRSPPRRHSGLALVGPAFVASIAYIDPGNFATNIEAGSRYGYELMWCVLGACLLAMPVQYLSAKVGVVTGKSLPEVCRDSMPMTIVRLLWLQAELVAICTDVAEFVGAAIGLNLLFGVSLPVAAAITGFITFLVLRMHTQGRRRFEVAVIAALGLVAGGFLYEVLRAGPSAQSSIRGLIPHVSGRSSIVLAAGIVGATVMPHAIYLHSALTRDRAKGMTAANRQRLLASQRLDVIVALGAAAVINLAMLAVVARVLHNSIWRNTTSLSGAAHGLGALAGGGAALVFAVALFVSGASSSSVGTFAGQVVMSGFTGRTIPLSARRAITMAPAVTLLASGYSPTKALIYSQVALSFGIPCALIPLIIVSAQRSVMGHRVNSISLTITAVAVAAIIVGLDGWLILQQII